MEHNDHCLASRAFLFSCVVGVHSAFLASRLKQRSRLLGGAIAHARYLVH